MTEPVTEPYTTGTNQSSSGFRSPKRARRSRKHLNEARALLADVENTQPVTRKLA